MLYFCTNYNNDLLHLIFRFSLAKRIRSASVFYNELFNEEHKIRVRISGVKYVFIYTHNISTDMNYLKKMFVMNTPGNEIQENL